MMRLKSYAYTSRARLDLSEDDITDIGEVSRHLNALDGITGLLLYDGIRFMQIMEGSEEAIDNLVERLRRDSRHSSFEVRDERSVETRSFPDWSMELVRVSEGYRETRKELLSILPAETSPAMRDLVHLMAEQLQKAAD